MKKTAERPKGTRVPTAKKKTGKVESWTKDKPRLMTVLVEMQKQIETVYGDNVRLLARVRRLEDKAEGMEIQ